MLLRRPGRQPFSLLLALMLCGYGAVVFGIYREYRAKSVLQLHGERVDAGVVDVYQRTYQSRKYASTCDVYAHYLFTPRGWSNPLKGSIRLGSCYENSPAAFWAVRKQTLPLAYDLTNPALVHLNLGDEVFREDVAKTLKLHILVITAITALGVALVTAMNLVRRPGSV